jgi:hypothetical protein
MTIVYAVGVFAVFGAAAVAMGWSSWRDTQKELQERELTLLAFFTTGMWGATLFATAVAIAGPIVILANG